LTVVKSQIVVVAGAAGDIGRSTRDEFERRGLTVVGWDKKESSDGRPIHLCDLLDGVQTAEATRTVEAMAGQLHHVIVVAGGGDIDELMSPGIECEDISTFRRVVEANLFTAFNVIHCCTPTLKAGSGNRSIVLLSSLNALGGYGAPGYSAAKAALSGLAKALAPQLGPHGIRINVLVLGTVQTENFVALANQQGKKADFAAISKSIPLRRTLLPGDVATAISSIALDMEAFTGADLVLDNGQVLNRRFV
jgi:NAD(P)-dependent dehydrogenase (short-subunit alcohol dehydrogenase family)